MTRARNDGPLSSFLARCGDGVAWRVNFLRVRFRELRRRPMLTWRAARKADSAIDQLRTMKAASAGRPFCGILLIEHMGDIIACEPVIAQMRAAQPEAFIVWVVRPGFAPLLTSHPGLDGIVFVDSLLSVERITESDVFDVQLDLHVNAKPTEVARRPYRKKIGNPSVDYESYIHKGSLLQSFSSAAGIEPESGAPTMYLPSEAVAAIDRLSLPDHFIVLHAESNYRVKDWSSPNWRALVRHILERYDTHVIEVGLKGVVDLEHPRFTKLSGKLSIVETAELIRRAAFFIGLDSGPAHMANAWRRPAFLLFARYYGSDTFNPFDGYYREVADAVILRYPGPLREQSTSVVIDALEACAMWKETHAHRKRGRNTSD